MRDRDKQARVASMEDNSINGVVARVPGKHEIRVGQRMSGASANALRVPRPLECHLLPAEMRPEGLREKNNL